MSLESKPELPRSPQFGGLSGWAPMVDAQLVDVDVIYDLQGEIAEDQWRLVCSSEILRYVQKKEKQYREANGCEWLNFRVMKISTLSELLPNVRDDRSPLAFGIRACSAGEMPKVPEAW